MVFRGLDADAKVAGDLLVGTASRDQLKDFAFARGEAGGTLGLRMLLERALHGLCDRLAEKWAAGRDCRDGLEKGFERGALFDHAGGAGLQGFAHDG